MALRLLATVRGWKGWTNDVLIRQHLWPLLQVWNKDPDSLREATVVCIVRLLGQFTVISIIPVVCIVRLL